MESFEGEQMPTQSSGAQRARKMGIHLVFQIVGGWYWIFPLVKPHHHHLAVGKGTMKGVWGKIKPKTRGCIEAQRDQKKSCNVFFKIWGGRFGNFKPRPTPKVKGQGVV
eukprot:NODE_1689_length_873_cov_33.351942_g1327_i0.p1 GENE.NODE_1689_length_873_cov_33.351942_g1327_i0~~NODE_1689_length_873_cov_33.351942_g1327_i0.p1  ORF type:complete len:109 (-),score=11.02 NODE_1689_length_873_cov_33.351942_g1327_i0:123-449(-)